MTDHRSLLGDFMSAQTGVTRDYWHQRRKVAGLFLDDHPDLGVVTDHDIDTWTARRAPAPSVVRNWRPHVRALVMWAREERGVPSPAARTRTRRQVRATAPHGGQRTQLEVTSAWREPIESWVNWLTSAGRPTTTLYLREYQLRKAAQDLRDFSPVTVTADDLTAWLAGKEWAPETRRSRRSALRSFFGWMQASGRRIDDPAALLPAVRRPRYVARPTPEAVIADTLTGTDSRVRLMVLLATRLGLRRGEIAALHTDDLIEDRAALYVRVMGKGRRERVLPIVDVELLSTLRGIPAGYVFPSTVGDHLTAAHVGRLVSRALPGKWTTHTLRHRFATVAYAGQRDLYAVQELLGHAQPETTRLYVQLPDGALRAAMGAAAGLP